MTLDEFPDVARLLVANMGANFSCLKVSVVVMKQEDYDSLSEAEELNALLEEKRRPAIRKGE